MSDYISRKEMLDAVEKLNIIPSIDGTGNPTPMDDFRVQFLGTVLRVSSVDVIPVVYCRDCQWYEGDCGWCDYWNGNAKIDDFCSYGKRREEQKDERIYRT